MNEANQFDDVFWLLLILRVVAVLTVVVAVSGGLAVLSVLGKLQ